MALINCPECGKHVSDTAPSCPHCGYILSERDNDFEPIVTQLSPPTRGDFKTVPAIIVALNVIIAIIIAFFVWLPGLIYLFLTLIVGTIVLVLTSHKYQQGKCPYCGSTLNFKVGSSRTFKCPNCGNVGKRNESTLESIHH